MLILLTHTVASVYYGSLDYDITHLIRDLNHGGMLDMLFTHITFTGSTIFMALIIRASSHWRSAKRGVCLRHRLRRDKCIGV